MQGVQGYVWLKLITPTIIVPTGHGFWRPRRGVLGFIAGWLVGPYVVAGPLANLLFAPLLMIVVFLTGLPTPLPVLGTVKKDLPAYAAGLRRGDRIIKVDGKPIETWDDLSETVRASKGNLLELEVRRPVNKGAAALTLNVAMRPKLVAPVFVNWSAINWFCVTVTGLARATVVRV